MGYVFYDIETTGLDKFFDQIITFAAIKTNDEFKIEDEFLISCKILPHIIPSPQALLINKINISELTSNLLPSYYEMSCMINKKIMQWTPSIFIGHNSIRFDELFLRQLFYQNLFNPYLTNINNNCRLDSLIMYQIAAILYNDRIKIPKKNGKNKFGLYDLAVANGFNYLESHTAINDARAVLFLCKLLYEDIPELWSNSVRFSKKSSVIDFVNNEDYFCLCLTRSDEKLCYHVIKIGVSPFDPNEILVFNLLHNPDKLMELTDDGIINYLEENIYVLCTFKANACPSILPEYDICDSLINHELNKSEIDRRVNFIKNNRTLTEKLLTIFYKNRSEFPSHKQVEGRLYEKFINNNDYNLMSRFHDIPWSSRYMLLEQISDDRIKELGLRVIFNEKKNSLPEHILSKLNSFVSDRILGKLDDCTWLTIQGALNDIDELLKHNTHYDSKLLLDLKSYLYEKYIDIGSV